MSSKYLIKYECTSHEVYFSNNLEDIRVQWPKIKCTQNWGAAKITIFNDLGERVREFKNPSEIGFDKLASKKFIRIDATTEAKGQIQISKIDIPTLEPIEFLNGLVTVMKDKNGKTIEFYSDIFKGDLKDTFSSKTIFYENNKGSFSKLKIQIQEKR